MKKLFVMATMALAIGLPLSSTQAATYTWTGAGFFGNQDFLWSNPNNWAELAAPNAGDNKITLVFPSSGAHRQTTNDIHSLIVSSIQFLGSNYVVHGKPAGNAMTLNAAAGNFSIFASGDNNQFASTIAIALGDANGSITVGTNKTLNVASRLFGNGGFTKFAPGTLRLAPTDPNTFAGSVTVSDGILRLEGGTPFFNGFLPSVTIPGPLTIGSIQGGNAQPKCLLWRSHQIADSSPVTVNGNGELLSADENDTIGSLTMNGGFVDTVNGQLTLNGNVLIQRPPSGEASQIDGHLDLGPIGRFFNVESNAYLYLGAVVSGGSFGPVPAGVNKLGAGWLSLEASANTFGGELYVGAGTVSISKAKQIGAISNKVSVANGGTFALGGVGTGPTVKDKTINLQTGGRLQALLDSAWNGPVQLYGAALIDVGTNATLNMGGQVSGVGGFTKTGPGELDLSGNDNNTFQGETLVNNGLLSLQKMGLFTNAIAISGRLTIGDNDDTKSPRVTLSADEEIAPTVPVVINENAKLNLQDHAQTLASFAVNGGSADSGTFGVFNLLGTLNATNTFNYYGSILGWMNLGDVPHVFHAAAGEGFLRIFARMIGGSKAKITKLGPGEMTFDGDNNYTGFTEILEGSIRVTHASALGGTLNGTAVRDGATLIVDSRYTNPQSLIMTNETLTLSGSGSVTYGAALLSFSTNTWQGLVILQGQSLVRTLGTGAQLTFLSRVEGPGGITKTESGKLIFAGVGSSSLNNTYTGPTIVQDGELVLAKHSGILANTSLAGSLILESVEGSAPIVRVQGREQFIGNNPVSIGAGTQLRIESPTLNSVGSLSGEGLLNFAVGSRLVTGKSNQDSLFAGTFQGGGINDTNVSMQGSGLFMLTGLNTLLGKMEVTGGTLRIDSAQPSARVDVKFQGTLGGKGSVNLITMRGGYLAPGSPVGKLHAASLLGVQSHALHLDIQGPALGTDYDQLELDAAPDLSNTQLGAALGNQFNPTNGQQFLILRNNSAAPITKPFLGSSEGATFYIDETHRMQITYLGGDGNDVVLKVVAVPGQFKGIAANGVRVSLSGCGTAGASYTLETTTTVEIPGSWTSLGNVVAGPDGLMQYVATDVQSTPHRFFRFIAP